MLHFATLPLPLLLLCLNFASVVYAHGYVAQVTIDGKAYQGNEPQGTSNPSIIRQISTIDPVMSVNDSNLNCGWNAPKATLVADANPGSKLTFTWSGGPGGYPWPHNIGPFFFYMAPCINTTCDQYDSINAEWFKIAEVGAKPGGTEWYQQNIMDGYPANVTLPADLAPGQYLIRHEIIALHEATTIDEAQYYPSCTQINVNGSETGYPTSNETCPFPGCYKDTDPGLYDPTVYNTPIQYTFPGPPLATFVLATANSSDPGTNPTGSGNGSSSGGSSGADPGADGNSGNGSSTSATSSGKGTCKVVRPDGEYFVVQHPMHRRSVNQVLRRWLSDTKRVVMRY